MPVSRRVKVLIAGIDPQTHSSVSRDVLIDGYVDVICQMTTYRECRQVNVDGGHCNLLHWVGLP